MNLSNLLRFDYWLDPAVTSQPAGRSMWMALGLALCAAIALFVLGRRRERALFTALALAATIAAAVVVGRILQLPVLGWRIGWLLAAIIALGAIVARFAAVARADGLIATTFAAFTFSASEPRPWRIATRALWWSAHLLSMALVAVNIATPLWPQHIGLAAALAPLPLLIATAPGLLAKKRNADAALAPFVYAYAVALLNFLGAHIDGPLNGLLYLPLALIISFGYAVAVGLRLAAGADKRFAAIGAALLITASVTWAAWAALTLRTHGVTGSDPYAYTQMGVDLAKHHTLAHAFPFVEQTYALSIESLPVVHIGYRIPTDVRRIAPTVWPIGYPWFTAAAWLLGGETGVFLLTPLFNLIALGLITLLVLRAPIANAPQRTAVAALTVFFTATSYQQVEWQMIPMADIAVQVFSLTALGSALFAAQHSGRRRIALAALAGFALGIAFDLRYTQVLIAPAIAFALALALPTAEVRGAKRLRIDAAFWIAPLIALIAVLPTFVYHTTWFGGPFHTGSDELSNFSLTRMPETLLRVLSEANWRREFGLLTPLLALGAVALWRSSRRLTAALALYFIPVFTLHIFYDYLRLRDILSLFPVLYVIIAVGVVTAWALVERAPARILRIALLFALTFVFVLRSMETLALPITRGFSAFGYLVAEQRHSFDTIATVTEADAAIGCSLNSGAVDLHANRRTFRPGTWANNDAALFIRTLLDAKKPVYLLIDGEEMQRAADALRSHFTLQEVIRVDVPFYFAGSGSENRKVQLVKISD